MNVPRLAACTFASLLLSFSIVAGVSTASSDVQDAGANGPATSRPAASSQPRGRNRPVDPPPADFSPLIAKGVENILNRQEGEAHAEWPYEGVYRVRGEIPIGYRVGGTAICATALIRAPGYEADQPRKEAVHRAVQFIVDGCKHPFMNPVYDGGYDVRGWGYTCGLAFLLELKARNLIPDDLAAEVEKTILWQISAICTTEINQVGGWNYARQQGRDAVSPPSPFMTAPTLLALFEAKKQGYEVDPSVVDRALATLEAARTSSGSVMYSGVEGEKSSEPTPGAVGRMLAVEIVLHQAGKGSVAGIRGAIDAFIVHWEWLDKRRAQPGTHVPPYNIAPYYFYYAHYYAAMATELLPQRERAEYRRRIDELLLRNKLQDGTWNDRVFDRTANYGTSMAIMTLMMPDMPAPARWQP